MKLQNISGRTYMHHDVILKAGEIADIPPFIAEIWLQSEDVIKFSDPVDAEKLETENLALKAKLKALEEQKGSEIKPVAKPVAKPTAKRKRAAKPKK
jgi:hypothetical protein